MKQILYIFLYAPYINWDDLIQWFDQLIKRKNNVMQFLFYQQKVWIHNKNLWHVVELYHGSVLTNCAIESYHRRLNSFIRASPSIEEFSKSLFNFDMKNYRELKTNQSQITKYQKFILKKDEISNLMEQILKESPQILKENNSEDLTSIENNSEEWYPYDESHNDLISRIIFDENLDNNTKIIDRNINNLLDQFHD